MLYFSIIYSLTVSLVLVLVLMRLTCTENNIESARALEICNYTSKHVVRGMGTNKFNKAKMIITASKAAPGICQIKH